MSVKYYNLWSCCGAWTSGFMRRGSLREYQNPNEPWELTLEEVISWLQNDWCYGMENLKTILPSLPIAEINVAIKILDLEIREIAPWKEQRSRLEYAMNLL